MRIHVVSIWPLDEEQKNRIRQLGDLSYHDARLSDPDIIDKCRNAEILIITPRVDQAIVPHLEQCRLISVQATGTDAFDIAEATRKGIVVCNVPDFGLHVVAEHAFALLLAVCRRLRLGRKLLETGDWRTGIAYQGFQLRGKTLGIFGFGRIGREIAGIAHGFQMRVISTTRYPDPEREQHYGVRFVTFPRLLEGSDFLILAAPLTDETRGIFGKDQFARLKQSAILINVARAGLIDQIALVQSLEDGWLAGAGIDVYDPEPPDPEHPLLKLDSVVATPHVAAASEETVQTLLEGAIANVEAFLNGHPQNIVNPAVFKRHPNSGLR